MGRLRVLGRMGDQSVTWESGDKKTFQSARVVFQNLVHEEKTHRGLVNAMFIEDLSEQNFLQDDEVILLPKMAGG